MEMDDLLQPLLQQFRVCYLDPGGGGTATVRVSRMCGGKDPVCEKFCTNKGPKIFKSLQ